MDRIVKAKVAEVSFGRFKFEGLMLPNGKYAIGMSQISKLFPQSVPPNRSLKQINSLLGTGFQSHKTYSELNPKEINYFTLSELEDLFKKLLLKKDPNAIDIAVDTFGLSFTELFNDAFGIVNTPETRQQYIEEKSLLRLREELTIAHGGFQAKCINLRFCARHVHDYATKQLVGRTATESINQVPINPEFIEYEKYSKEFIGINHVNDDEVKFLERLINFKRYFSSKKPRINEDWKEYTDRILTFI